MALTNPTWLSDPPWGFCYYQTELSALVKVGECCSYPLISFLSQGTFVRECWLLSSDGNLQQRISADEGQHSSPRPLCVVGLSDAVHNRGISNEPPSHILTGDQKQVDCFGTESRWERSDMFPSMDKCRKQVPVQPVYVKSVLSKGMSISHSECSETPLRSRKEALIPQRRPLACDTYWMTLASLIRGKSRQKTGAA